MKPSGPILKLAILLMFIAQVSCSYDPSGLPSSDSPGCGNNLAETGEECDGTDIPDSCVGQGFTGGILGCTSQCRFDITGCTSTCGECVPNTARCTGNMIYQCTDDGHGCGQWIIGSDCDLTDQYCAEADGQAVCETQCSDQCTLDRTRCHDTTYMEECVSIAAGEESCLQWVFGDVCGPGYECRENTGGAQCVSICDNQCTLGETRCSQDSETVESCITGPQGCTIWTTSENCPQNETCIVVSSSQAICGVCDVCPTGAIRCSAGAFSLEECVTVGDCTRWETGDPCPLDTICTEEAGVSDCRPCHNCITDERRCSTNGADIEQCQEDAYGCTRFQPLEHCDISTLFACTDDGTDPLCTPQGNTCPDPQFITLPFHLELGSMDSYTSTVDYNHSYCGYNGYTKPDLFLATVLSAGQRIHFYETGTADAGLAISQNCNNYSCLAQEDDTQTLIFDVPSDGTYIFIFEETSGSGNVSLHIEEVPSICTQSEQEPNNDLASADSFVTQPEFYCHSLTVGTDNDCVNFSVGATGGSLTMETGSAFGMGTCPGDTYVELFNDFGAPIFIDDDDGNGSCSLMDHTVDPEVRYLTPGEYTLCIHTYYTYETIAGRIATHIVVDPATYTTLLLEDFEGGTFPPAGWTTQTQGTPTTAGWTPVVINGNTQAQVLTSSSETGVGYGLHTPALDFSGTTGGVLQFITQNDCGYNNTMYIYYSTDGFQTMTALWTDNYSTDPLRQMQLTLPPALLGESSVEFAFVVLDNYNYGQCQWSVDDVLIAVW